jgi:hypothetical protein
VGKVIGAKNQVCRREFFEALADPNVLQLMVKRHFEGLSLDSWPEFEISIEYENGRIVKLSSRSTRAYMLPWQLERDDDQKPTYNANISRALASLLPEKTLNRWAASTEYFLERAVVEQINLEILIRKDAGVVCSG